ncbi:MAG: membrane protein insertion efficiency factor YidD [Candidatus Binatia bacterium]
MAGLGKKIFIFIVSGYRIFLSPLLPSSCRFFPSCSAYAEEAIERRGMWRGSVLTLRRLLRCRPGRPGGHDPVP